MVAKCDEHTIDQCLSLLDKLQVIQLKIWENTEGEYSLSYITLDDIENNKSAYMRSEDCLNTPQALTDVEKIINLLKEFKSALKEDMVKSFIIDFSCYKRMEPQFTYSVSYKGRKPAVDEKADQTNDSVPTVEVNTEKQKEPYISILESMNDTDKIPGLFLRIEPKEGAKNKARKYQELTIAVLRDTIMNM